MAEVINEKRVRTFGSDGSAESIFLQGMSRKAENAV
jgi:hypothetical protein